jgi:hypothetical protein
MNVVLTFEDETGREWLAAAVVAPLRNADGERCAVAEMVDRAFTLKGFTVATR